MYAFISYNMYIQHAHINERTRLKSNNNLFTEERLNALISLKNKININLKINVT